MPLVHGIRKFVQVPDTWEGWVMRVMTASVVLMLIAAIVLLQLVIGLKDAVDNGRAERNAYQVDQTVRVCHVLRLHEHDPVALKALKC